MLSLDLTVQSLIRSDTAGKYLDLYKYIELMQKKFEEYSTDASPMLENIILIIAGFEVQGEAALLIRESLKTVPNQDLLLLTLQQLFN